MADITRILVPTDFSAPAEGALTYALDLASKLGATVSLVHVFDDLAGIHSGEFPPMPADMRAEIMADLRRRVAEAAARDGQAELNPPLRVGPTARGPVVTQRKR